jgi:peptidoglycan/LPS O-acetylase OafA/YrhL
MPTQLPYRAGLDGLRAVAVAAVLLYHADIAWFQGGFVGVDVFFVLSGYLITSLLLTERAASGTVRLGRFWARRARRLLPAAVLVIAVSLLIVAAFQPGSLGSARGDALASLLYVNNWHEIVAGHSYFAAFARPSLVQHLWSLSVEEQFYLLWPPLLAVAAARMRRGRVAWLLLGGIVVSTALCALLYRGGDPSRVYYGTDTRAAPLLLGALLAFGWPAARLTRDVGRGASGVLDAIGLAGLAGLLVAIVTWRDFDPWLYPWGLLVVALASAAIVAAAVHPAARVGRFLGVGPLRWIGQRSYGIYLWHWPVMALTRPGIDVSASRWVLAPAQIGLAVALAALSFRFVEQPIRRGEALRWLERQAPRARLAAVTAGAVAVAVVAGWAFSRSVPVTARAQVSSPAARVVDARRVSHPASRPRVLAVGASVMLGARAALERRLGPRTLVDAAVGRQTGDVIERLAAYRAAGRLPPRVVVQLGDNGPVWGADARRLRTALRGVRRVVLVNVRVPRSWEGEVDGMLVQAARGWPAARLADWRAASGRGDLLYDGAHPNLAGQSVYARVVARALR